MQGLNYLIIMGMTQRGSLDVRHF